MQGYLEHFGLKAFPFSTTPDPNFAFATTEHQLAVTKIQYCVTTRQGIFLLQGPIGAGKTTISHFMLKGWRNNPAFAVAHITNPSVRTQAQFLRLILSHYGVEAPRYNDQCWAALRALLLRNHEDGKTTVLVIDEAQKISAEGLETLTHISNEQTAKHKLVQIVLLAQTNIERKLSSKPALRERIALASTLNPLSYDDAMAVLEHRVSVAGGKFRRLFPSEELTHDLYAPTRGIPRRLCILADNCLINAFARGLPNVDRASFEAALKDLTFKRWGES